jgi:hypothetical protein
MHLRAFAMTLLFASLCLGQQKTDETNKPFRATDDEGKPKLIFAPTDTVLLEFRNPGPETVMCLTGLQPELSPNEGFDLERWTGNGWEAALRPFETRSYKAILKSGERVVRRWPARWGELGRYRATLVCGQTAFDPVEFEIGSGQQTNVSAKTSEPAKTDREPVGVFAVTEAGLSPDEAKVLGPCPATITFTGYITTNGPGTVTYTFTRSDGARGPAFTLAFKDAGTQAVTTTWTLGGTALAAYDGWQAIKILTPNEVESSHETGRFVLSCNPGPGH